MPNEDKPRLSSYQVEEKAGDAAAILHHPVFVDAMENVYSRAVGTLLAADIGSLTATQAHAMMKAVNEIQTQLKQYVDDHKLRQKYHGGEKHG